MGKWPCEGCRERRPGCWGKCARYRAARAEMERARTVEKEETKIRAQINDYERDNIRRARNR